MLEQIADTASAFDSAANNYDGALGNNALIQRMRGKLIAAILRDTPRGARLLDLGCGAGIDAVDLAARGYRITALDSSSAMVERTRARIAAAQLKEQVQAIHFGIHELAQLDAEPFDGIYSDLGPLNCIPDLRQAATQCARLLKPRGKLIASVIGRYCPWEIAFYAARGDWQRARVRWSRDAASVPLGGETVWTRYYSPREFYRGFENEFEMTALRALALFMPPPYLIHAYARAPKLFAPLQFLDDALGSAPLLRNTGDHFLMTLSKRE
ncbi:MAG: class I SAM-dependent methyltransferase [Chloroflexi bacterium]|nr:class I SAM-dependent methyltransferase [Chloroflexota bacterium]